MEENKFYILPELTYGYKDLAPYISEEQLTVHHQKHHQAYVKNANTILEKINKARAEGVDFDAKSVLKDLSFNAAGHMLHSLFWKNLGSPGKAGKEPGGKLADSITKEFGSFERFKKEFSQAAISVEGSGWSALVFDKETERLLILQIEKHNSGIVPELKILLVLDVFEHAYYLDYRNERGKYIESFWNIVNWGEVEKRFNASI